MKKNFIIFGHRGAAGHEPENTLLSLAKGVELGAPWIEFDVRIVENTPVVFHDRELKRCAGVDGLLEQQTLPFVRSLDVGKGERIPLLREALDLLKGKASAAIELKGKGPLTPTLAELQRALSAGWTLEQILVVSFDHTQLEELRRAMPDVPIGVTEYGHSLYTVETARRVGASAVLLKLDSISQARVDEIHAAGLPVYVFTANSSTDIALVKSLGCDGVITDYPDRALQFA